MVKVIIKTSKKYASYLAKHLQKEHPKTKGHIYITQKSSKKYYYDVDDDTGKRKRISKGKAIQKYGVY